MSSKTKIFWLKSWQGLFIIVLLLSLPCYWITNYLDLKYSQIPFLIVVSIAAIRKIIADIMIIQ